MQSTDAAVEAVEFGEIPGQIVGEKFGQILSNRLPSLYRGAYRILGNSADAEDAVQDALLAAYTHLDQFRGQAKMSTWLAAIVHNSALMQLRRRLRHIDIPLHEPIGEVEEHSAFRQLADRRPSPEDDYRNTELRMHLIRFQSRLTPPLRKTFQLRDIDGLSVREAARILGVPLGTVKAQSARARKKLREWMRRAPRPRNRNLSTPTARCASARVSP